MEKRNLERQSNYVFEIKSEDAGERLDIYISKKLEFLSRSQIKNLIIEGFVKVNNVIVKAGYRIKFKDRIELFIPEIKEGVCLPEKITINIIYEDESIIVINKDAGIVVHPAPGNYSGTLVNALLYYSKSLSSVGGLNRPGIVHRLDKWTSGILVVAKDDSSHYCLKKQFENHTVKRKYTALVYGKMDDLKGTIDSYISRHPVDRKKMVVNIKKGRESITEWVLVKNYDELSLLDIFPKTGRTHQIRVHMNSIGHPIVGDQVYGKRKIKSTIKNRVIKDAINELKRQALHASLLGFFHPVSGKYIEFTSELPEDILKIISIIESSNESK